MLSPEELSNLQLLRARISSGEQIPIEEMREAIVKMRADRMAAARRAKESKSRSVKTPARSAQELLGGLGIKTS
jgi:chorismate mutase